MSESTEPVQNTADQQGSAGAPPNAGQSTETQPTTDTVNAPKVESDPSAELKRTHEAMSTATEERTESAAPTASATTGATDSPSASVDIKRDDENTISASEDTPNPTSPAATTAAAAEETENNDNGDGDDNDDDDDDEEDEDEDVGPRKRQRQERNRFLDIEAEVSDDEDEDEDEEESELVREGFITRDDEHEEEGGHGRDRLHRELDQDMNKSSEEEAQRLAKELRERYGRSSSKQYRAAAQDGYVPQRFLLPSVDTATVWGVRCRPGKEKELVKKLFKKKLNLDRAMGKKKLKILAIFQRDNYHGRIYIEAPKQSVIEKFCNGVPDIYVNQKLLIPVQELPLLLKPNKSDDVTLEEGNYVRIKRGIYKGDLAIIDQISENNLEVMLKIVPRLDYGKFDEIDPTTNQRKPRRATFANRAPPQLFNPTMALRLDQANLYKRDDHHFTYKNEDYVDGYLYKSFRIQYIETKNITPTVEELARFSSKDGAVDLSKISQSLKKAQASKVTFQTGDRVEILNGEQRGSKGTITKTTTEIATVRLPQFPTKPLEFPILSLRKIFEPGDHVTVINGDHQGDAGLVLIVKQGQVTFMSNQTRQEVTITANNLSKSIDSTPTSSEYALHDIVELSAKNVACIIQAGHDIFKVLDESGKVFTINKGSILNKVETGRLRIATIDSKGNEIKIGDSVIEKLGARREGQILFIQNQQVFVVSKKIIENAGVFVLNTSNIEAVASKGNMLNNSLDLSKMNPDIISKMGPPSAAMARPQQNGPAREVAIGKTVRIRSAGYKGQLGIVKDVNGDKATIELHSKNKHITVDKRKLTYYNREGGEGISYDELVNRRGRVPRGRMGPSYVSAGVPMAAGGPGMEGSSSLPGGMTPGWNNAFDGGKTPAVNAGGPGGASAWGGASSWGGQANGGASTWGPSGGSSAWGGQGTGATSTWGGASSWGNKSSYGGASTWASGGDSNGAASTWGGGAASAYGGASTWGNKEGGASAWGGNQNNTNDQASQHNGGNTSTWGNNQNQGAQGNRSAWGNQSQHQSGGNSTWGSN